MDVGDPASAQRNRENPDLHLFWYASHFGARQQSAANVHHFDGPLTDSYLPGEVGRHAIGQLGGARPRRIWLSGFAPNARPLLPFPNICLPQPALRQHPN